MEMTLFYPRKAFGMEFFKNPRKTYDPLKVLSPALDFSLSAL